jgi:hypothetical protein
MYNEINLIIWDAVMNSEIVMYQTEGGLTKIEITFDNDTVWLSIDQMSELFQRDRSVNDVI